MKRKMTKKVVLSAILACTLFVGGFGVCKPEVCKAESESLSVGNIIANSRTWYQLYDSNSVYYDESGHTLYLSDATITGFTGIQYDLCGYDEKKPFTIVLKGKNVIETDDLYGSNTAYGIRSEHFSSSESTKLIIKGNGSLDIRIHNSNGYGVGIAAAGGIVIKGKADVRITLDEDMDGCGISLDNEHTTKLKMDGSAKLSVYSTDNVFYKVPFAFGKKYVPTVKAGDSEDDIKVNKKKPSADVYTSYAYVSIKRSK